jgi:hypothetical protein
VRFQPVAAARTLVLLAVAGSAWADSTPQTLPFAQDWTNTGLITATDNWSGVPGIQGFRGDGLAAAAADPQTVLVPDDPGVLDVNANQTNPDTFTTGGVTEFHIANPVVALTGSNTATAPYVKLYLNTTGQAGITVAYNLRDIDGSVDNSVQPVAMHFRVGASGSFTNVGAAFVADASGGPSQATLVTPVCAALPAAAENEPLVEVRIMTTNAVGNDEWIGVDDIVVSTTPCGGGGEPLLVVGDVMQAEGSAGNTTFGFAVTLSAPAPAAVTFDASTADGTATTADNDYQPLTNAPFTIPMGQTGTIVTVNVVGDTTPEPNETFLLNLANIVGATPIDVQGSGIVLNDDVPIVPIHDIQGPGNASPIVGSTVTTTGIVTGVRTNGFFVQAAEADYDADPNTSEGVFVFSGTPVPAGVVVGNRVQVTATVAEFVPTQDPLQPPLTELTSPTVVLVSTGHPLPMPVNLFVPDLPPTGSLEQLERLEGMRVAANLRVVAPTLGNINEPNATATTTGVFVGVIFDLADVPRPFREPGIRANDPPPSGSTVTIPPVPRFDGNPERLRVDSDGLVGALPLDVSVNAILFGLVGPLDWAFRTWTILPDPATPPTVIGGSAPPAWPTRRTGSSRSRPTTSSGSSTP